MKNLIKFRLVLIDLLIIGSLPLLIGCFSNTSSSDGITNRNSVDVAVSKLISCINSNFKNSNYIMNLSNPSYNLEVKEQKFIKLSDFFSDIYWVFGVDNVERISSSKVIIYTSYRPTEKSVPVAKVNFIMIFVDDDWHLEDIEFEQIPEVVVTDRKIAGIITDSITKEPVVGALIILFQGGKKLLETVTNKDGYYLFDNLLPGVYDIVILRSGYEDKTIGGITVN